MGVDSDLCMKTGVEKTEDTVNLFSCCNIPDRKVVDIFGNSREKQLSSLVPNGPRLGIN